MKINKSSRINSAVVAMLGAAVLAASANAGTPPTRQTPYIVPKDKQGVVEVGPCQMPPCVGGRQCVPNARDYGYYEATWRKWPTQQRYDQSFPQAVGANPIPAEKDSDSIMLDSMQLVPAPVPTEETKIEVPSTPSLDTSSIAVPDDVEPSPVMGNYETPSLVPETTVVPQTSTIEPVPPVKAIPMTESAPIVAPVPAPKAADPLLDYSSNTVPGISTASAKTNDSEILVPETPASAEPAPLETTPGESAPATPAASGDDSASLDLPTTSLPAPDTDSELTAPAPSKSSPLLDTEETPRQSSVDDDSLSVPVTRQAPKENHSIVVPKEGMALAPLSTPKDPYVPLEDVEPAVPVASATNPFDRGMIQVSHEESQAVHESKNPFQTAVIPSEVTNAAPSRFVSDETTVQDSLSEDQIGLEGFCPVTLLETEEWVEGNTQWSVMHHGVTYYLSNASQVQKFLANPAAYTPALDGADPVIFAETGRKVSGKADFCSIFEGKLYMFSSEENLNKFFANTNEFIK